MDKFGESNHCIELRESCKCGGTGHYLLLEPKDDKEARIYGSWACYDCFKRGGQSPFPVGMWVGKKTKEPWHKVKIEDLILIKKVYAKPVDPPLVQYQVPPKRDTSNRDMVEFISHK
jgi:hypothetical protein